MAKVPTLPPIPSWVYFWPPSGVFMDMQHVPKSPAFQSVWLSRYDEFPKSPEEVRERWQASVDQKATANTLELLPPAYKLRHRYLLAGYLHLITACATPAAFQLVPPQCSGWGMVATATLTTYTLFFLGALHVITYFRKF